MEAERLILLRGLSRLHIYPPSGAQIKNDARVREGLRAFPAGMLHHFQQTTLRSTVEEKRRVLF